MLARGNLGRLWFIIRSEPQREMTCHAHLIGRGFQAYLPTIQRRQLRGRREQVRSRPMFPGYLFAAEHPMLGDVLRRIPGTMVRPFLMLGGGPATLYQVEMDIIRQEELRIEDHRVNPKKAPRYVKGELVRISEGLFVGFNGEVDRLDDADRIRVLVNGIAGKVPVELALHSVEKI